VLNANGCTDGPQGRDHPPQTADTDESRPLLREEMKAPSPRPAHLPRDADEGNRQTRRTVSSRIGGTSLYLLKGAPGGSGRHGRACGLRPVPSGRPDARNLGPPAQAEKPPRNRRGALAPLQSLAEPNRLCSDVQPPPKDAKGPCIHARCFKKRESHSQSWELAAESLELSFRFGETAFKLAVPGSQVGELPTVHHLLLTHPSAENAYLVGRRCFFLRKEDRHLSHCTKLHNTCSKIRLVAQIGS